MDWTTGRLWFDPRQRQKDFSSDLCVQTGYGAYPASCPMYTGGPFSGAKARPKRDADHSPPRSAEVKNEYELCYFSPQAHPWRAVGQLLGNGVLCILSYKFFHLLSFYSDLTY
jgi:hypothetical protein